MDRYIFLFAEPESREPWDKSLLDYQLLPKEEVKKKDKEDDPTNKIVGK